MIRNLVYVLIAVVLISHDNPIFAKEPKGTAKGGDVQQLQGTWLADVQPGIQNRLELEGGRLRLFKLQDKIETLIWDGHFSVNELANPKQMDWTPLRHNRQSPPANLAIYQLEGDLLIVIGNTAGPRPAVFFSGGGSHRPKTVVYRRINDEPRDGRKLPSNSRRRK